MGFLGIFLLVIFVLCSLLLIVLVLLQDDQGEGLGGLFGGGSSTAFGSRSGNILTKFTSILGGTFLVTAFALAWINKTPESGDLLGAARRGAGTESQITEWWIVDPEDGSPQREEPASPVEQAGEEQQQQSE